MTDTTITARRNSRVPENPSVFPVTSVAWALILVSVAIRAWAAFGSWFYEDDFEFLAAVALGENDLEWYFTPHNVHFMPLSLLLVTPIGLIGGFPWWAAALQITVLYAAAAVACWWMLTRLFGAQPRILAPLTFYLFSPLLIPAITWWAAAVNVVAVQAPLFVLIGAHVEYLRSRRRRWLVVAGLMIVLVSGLYVKALVVTAVLGLFTLCYATEGPSVGRRFLTTVVRWWRIWAVYVALCLVTIAVYLRQSEATSTESGAPMGEAVDSLVLRNLVPSLLGGPWSWADMGGYPRQLANPSDLMVAAALAVVVGLFAYAVHRWQNAWMPLVLLAPPVIATFVGITAFRTGSFPFLSLETRYWADILPYLVLAVGVSTMDLPGLPRQRRRRAEDAPAPPPSFVLGVAAAYVAGSLLTTVGYVSPWHTDFPTRKFVETAVAVADAEGDEMVVADTGVPGSVMSASFFPANTPNRLFAPVPGSFRGVEAGVDLMVLSEEGLPEQARAEAALEADYSDDECFTSGDLELPSRTFDFPFWATAVVSFEHATTLYITAGTARHAVEVQEGRQEVSFRTMGAIRRIELSNRNDAEMCPATLRVGPQLEIP